MTPEEGRKDREATLSLLGGFGGFVKRSVCW